MQLAHISFPAWRREPSCSRRPRTKVSSILPTSFKQSPWAHLLINDPKLKYSSYGAWDKTDFASLHRRPGNSGTLSSRGQIYCRIRASWILPPPPPDTGLQQHPLKSLTVKLSPMKEETQRTGGICPKTPSLPVVLQSRVKPNGPASAGRED